MFCSTPCLAVSHAQEELVSVKETQSERCSPGEEGEKNALAENRQTTEKSLHFLPFILGDANARLRQSVVHDLQERRRWRRMEGS